MNNLKYKYIFIDIDDTLLDFQAYVKCALKDGFEKYSLGTYQDSYFDIFTEINIDLWKKIEAGTLDLEGLKLIRFNLVFEKIGIVFDGVVFETYFREQLNESAILVEDAEYLLKELSSKYVICLATNGPTYQQRHRIEISELNQYVSYYFISEEIGCSKPGRGFYLGAFELLKNSGETPESNNCLFIGDSISSDILGGNSFGMDTLLFDPLGRYDLDILNGLRKPTYICSKLKDIPEIINCTK